MREEHPWNLSPKIRESDTPSTWYRVRMGLSMWATQLMCHRAWPATMPDMAGATHGRIALSRSLPVGLSIADGKPCVPNANSSVSLQRGSGRSWHRQPFHWRKEMSTHTQSKWREILCEICGQTGQASRVEKHDICITCYRNAPSTRCERCRRLKHCVSPKTGLCPHCMARPEGTCARCSQVSAISNQEAWLCSQCERLRRQSLRQKERRQVKVTCTACRKMCSSFLIKRAICESCWKLEHNGRAICVQCNKLKVIYQKTMSLCKPCYRDHLAPKGLSKYIEAFTAPNSFTTMLFQLLVTTIDWPNVTHAVEQRFHAFGEFLQTHPFHEPLTWQTIEDTCATLVPANRQRPQFIRQCLLDVGYLLAAKGQIESRETYIAIRKALGPLKYVPSCLQGRVERYTDWLWERKLTPAAIRAQLAALASFWTWCELRDIQSPELVSGGLVTEYLLSLYWKWRCTHCQGTMPFEPSNRQAPQRCAHCSAIGTLIQTSWCAQQTVANHRTAIRGFFDWARV